MGGTTGMLKDFERYPKYYNAYLRAFDRMLKKRNADGKPMRNYDTAEKLMHWWIYNPKDDNDLDQLIIENYTEETK